uniref:Uncharacterized protein n=1 Tax=Setaria italica TaxID=4555 RepID=K4A419_SETIT
MGMRRRRVPGRAHPRLVRRRTVTCPRHRRRRRAPLPRTAPPRQQRGGAQRGTWHGPLLLALAWGWVLLGCGVWECGTKADGLL